MTEKEKIKKLQKVAILNLLLVNELEELNVQTKNGKEIIIKGKEYLELLEKMLENVFKSAISSNDNFMEVSNKIDTIIRKNFDNLK